LYGNPYKGFIVLNISVTTYGATSISAILIDLLFNRSVPPLPTATSPSALEALVSVIVRVLSPSTTASVNNSTAISALSKNKKSSGSCSMITEPVPPDAPAIV